MIIKEITNLLAEKNESIPVLLGPTAIGKTKTAIDLAIELNAEIISCDSRMVFKFMDIGTSKPTEKERKEIKHHLIDMVNPDEEYNVALFQRDTYKVIEDIKCRGKIPLLVGGTMLYIDAVVNNYNLSTVEPDFVLRAELEKLDTEQLFTKLKNLDPDHADSISSNNRMHIIRPLEVVMKTGKKFSELSGNNESKYKYIKFGLNMDREDLYKQINNRVEDQLKMGLLEETRELAKKYDYNLPSMTGLGYKQMGYFLRGEMSFDEAKDILKRDTRHFAKRQLTWWRRDKEINWLSV